MDPKGHVKLDQDVRYISHKLKILPSIQNMFVILIIIMWRV
jgi:hypothetical protein